MNKANPTILAEKVRKMTDTERLREFGIEILAGGKVTDEFGKTYGSLVEWASKYNEIEYEDDYPQMEKFGGKGGKEYF